MQACRSRRELQQQTSDATMPQSDTQAELSLALCIFSSGRALHPE
jgi:hypothetical protein